MSEASLIDITVDHNSRIPIFQQIYNELRDRITMGTLHSNSKLPSSRAFAQELGVSRSSIVNAYDQLVAEGYAEGRPGSGVFVSNLPELRMRENAPPSGTNQTEPEFDFKVAPFYPGVPDMRMFPYEKWGRCVARVARERPRDLLDFKNWFGDHRLRKAISQHLAEWRGIHAGPERIIITAGALGGLELIIRTLTSEGDYIGLENPGYRAFRQFVKTGSLKPLWLDVDNQGACLPDKCDQFLSLVILTASFQYPLGGAMPTGRRTDFLNAASEKNFHIIEDDFDSEFRYSGKPIQSLAGMDADGRVIYVGSFSKVFSVGLRLGYVVVPENTIGKFSEALNSINNVASVVPQSVLAEFIESGEFHKYIRRMRRTYAQRRKLFMQRLQELNSYIKYNDFQAGMQIAVHFRKNVNDTHISDLLQDKGLVCPALSTFYTKAPSPGLLMGFCSFTEEEINQGMDTFNSIIRKNA